MIALFVSVAVAVSAGLVGCFAVMRRMTLAADAISHVALPGIGMALAFGVDPLLGATAMLTLGVLLIWALERRAGLAVETVIGVVFSLALAVGSLLASGEDLMDALFGGAGRLTPLETGVGLVGAAGVTAFVLSQRHRLVIPLVSPEIARTAGIHVERQRLWFLLMFALTVALGLRYLGVLLMGSLVIIPPATARGLARDLTAMLTLSVGVAVLSTVVGTALAASTGRPTGPLIVIVASALFFVSFPFRRER